jgi:EpsI family protein
MLLTMLCLVYISHSENIHPKKPFSSFPKQIGEWAGKEERFDQEIYDVLGVDDSFVGNYMTQEGRQVNLYVGFYQSQREGQTIHSPKHCMPGAGWNIVDTSSEELTIPGRNPERIRVAKLTLEKGTQRQVALYWYQSRGRIIRSEYMQKVYLIMDSIAKRRTDGSFVRLIAPAEKGEEAKAIEDLVDFARLVIPTLGEYLPS